LPCFSNKVAALGFKINPFVGIKYLASLFRCVKDYRMFLKETVKRILPAILAVQNSQLLQNEPAPAIPYIQGKPGIGKSYLFNKLRETEVFEVIIEQPALRPLEYWSGIPFPADGKVQWSIPEAFSRILKVAQENPNKRVLWIWDDFHIITREIQNYLFELLTWRELHHTKLPNNVLIVLIGNNSKAAGRMKLLSPIVNRTVFLPVEVNYRDWVDWASRKTEDTDMYFSWNWEEVAQKDIPINDLVVKFIEKNPDWLTGEESQIEPFPSPRSWTNLGRILSAYEQLGNRIDTPTLRYLAAGTVGQTAASELVNFARILIDIDLEKAVRKTKQWLQELTAQKDETEIALTIWGVFERLRKEYSEFNEAEIHKFVLTLLEQGIDTKYPGAAAELAAGLRRLKGVYITEGETDKWTWIVYGPDLSEDRIINWVLERG
jgi:sulfur relay (sulfurtransferase) DsrC/TusE family protein